ncbi:MAG: peptidylprolyl isomerase [Candidatus Doudnabacteria bacterium]|nr:peptidylprolyl isomerase [Candidatus Doudnabacteria bacterium]
MRTNTKKILKHLPFAVSLLVVLGAAAAAVCLVWLYSGDFTPVKQSFFARLPLPVAMINNRPVFAGGLLWRERLAEKLPGATVEPAAIYSRIIAETKISQIAKSRGLGAETGELESAYSGYAAQENYGGQANFDDVLASYGISRQSFIDEELKSGVILAKLQTWFYGQTGLNSQAYSQANNLIAQIQNGQDMQALAKNFSQDGSSADLSGDLGFVDIERLLPELREPVDALGVGQVKIIPSRYGLQIVKLEGKSGNLLHLRAIFIKGADFQPWLAGQELNLKVINFINI